MRRKDTAPKSIEDSTHRATVDTENSSWDERVYLKSEDN